MRARCLIREIVRVRTDSGLSMDTAASRLDWSKSKLYRIEAGRTRISTDDLEDMLDLYGVRSPQREALIQLGRDTRKRGRWTAYIGVKAAAGDIRINAHVIPGIFQTPGSPAISSSAFTVCGSANVLLPRGRPEPARSLLMSAHLSATAGSERQRAESRAS